MYCCIVFHFPGCTLLFSRLVHIINLTTHCLETFGTLVINSTADTDGDLLLFLLLGLGGGGSDGGV